MGNRLATSCTAVLLACCASTGPLSAQQVLIGEQFVPLEASPYLASGPVVYGRQGDDGRRTAMSCEHAVGKRVQVEGILWSPPPDAEPRKSPLPRDAGPWVIHEAGRVSLAGVEGDASQTRGKLVRVIGTLRPHTELNARLEAWHKSLEEMRWREAPIETAAGLTSSPLRPARQYRIEAASLEVIDKVVEPRLVLLPEASEQ